MPQKPLDILDNDAGPGPPYYLPSFRPPSEIPWQTDKCTFEQFFIAQQLKVPLRLIAFKIYTTWAYSLKARVLWEQYVQKCVVTDEHFSFIGTVNLRIMHLFLLGTITNNYPVAFIIAN